MNLSALSDAPLFGLLGLVISALPLLAGVWYAIRPDERGLALMRPLPLSAIFASVSNLLPGVANGLHAVGATSATNPFRRRQRRLASARSRISRFSMIRRRQRRRVA